MTDLATRLTAIADAFEREFPQYGGGVYREAADALASITRERDAMREALKLCDDDFAAQGFHELSHVRSAIAAALVNGEGGE